MSARLSLITALFILSGCTSDPVPGHTSDAQLDADAHTAPCVDAGDGWLRCDAALPTPRQEHAVVTWNDTQLLLVAGVDDRRNALDSVLSYTPQTQHWQELTKLPTVMHHPNTVVHNGTLHVVGFLSPAFREDARVFSYAPSTDTWLERNPMPRPRGAAVALSLGEHVYVIGGLAAGQAVATVDAWDPDTDTWRTLPDMPEIRDHLAAAALNGEIYVAGGRAASLSTNSAALDIFDPESNTWRSATPMPSARGGVAHAVFRGELLVFGGETRDRTIPDGVFDTVTAYNPQTDTWRTLPPLPLRIHGTGAAVIDSSIYIPGGAPTAGFDATDTLQIYTP